MISKSNKYIKQDINFLEFPLWFVNLRHDGYGFIWKDIEGYEYRSSYTPPDKVDILILLYLLKKSQQEGYQSVISCTKYEILKACGFPTNPQYYARLKESFLRWTNVTIQFEGTFYDKGNYESIAFHIMSEKIDGVNGKITICLEPYWLLKIKESQYFKYINFELYKALKRPVSRRLHEWLCKSFISRSKCFIRLTNLGKKLTLYKRKRADRATKNVIYASDVLVAIKPAINEINRLSREPDVLEKTGIKPQDLFTITYEITGIKQDRLITFEKHSVITTEVIQAQQQRSSNISILIDMLKRKTKKLEKVIESFYKEKGFEYVKWSILYTNTKAKKSYSTYLQQTLNNNWAEGWSEEEREKIEAKNKKKEEERSRRIEQEKIEAEKEQARKEMPIYLEKVKKLDIDIKVKLWKEAEKKVDKDHFNRDGMLKIEYHGLLWQYFEEHGESFVKALRKDLKLSLSLEKPC